MQCTAEKKNMTMGKASVHDHWIMVTDTSPCYPICPCHAPVLGRVLLFCLLHTFSDSPGVLASLDGAAVTSHDIISASNDGERHGSLLCEIIKINKVVSDVLNLTMHTKIFS